MDESDLVSFALWSAMAALVMLVTGLGYRAGQKRRQAAGRDT